MCDPGDIARIPRTFTLPSVSQRHTRLTMYYIRPLLHDIVAISLRLCHGFSTNFIGYRPNCIGAVTQSNTIDTNTQGTVTNTSRRQSVTKSLSNHDNITQ